MRRSQLVLVGIVFLMVAAAVLATAQTLPLPAREPLDDRTQQAAGQTDTFELACSPPPQCFRDRDCDRICGKGNGTCRRVNSCYNECLCSLAFDVSGV